MHDKFFIDTNVLLYRFSSDAKKAQIAQHVFTQGGTISVQVLNEITNVAKRKLMMPWPQILEFVSLIQQLFIIEPITLETHQIGCHIAKKYGYSVYDSMIIAAALLAECSVLYSEDMHNSQIIEKQLTIQNPFAIQQKT